jgi:hypothetical protein
MFMLRIFFITRDLRRFVPGSLTRLPCWPWVSLLLVRLTVGVLVEELVSDCLGENGHKIFMEDEDEYEESGLDGDIINDNRGTQERMEELEEDSQEEIAGYPSDFAEKPEFDDDELGSQSDFH